MTALKSALDDLLGAQPPRAGSLVVTLFGDCISQQGGCVWLGSLVGVMAEFGLNSRQVRTAIFRLAQDGWVTSTQRGRRSYYRFSEFGHQQYTRAAKRIYAAKPGEWDGQWTLVMDAACAAGERDELRKRLAWVGFGQLQSGVLAYPSAEHSALDEVLNELGLSERVVVWCAQAVVQTSLPALVSDAWALDELARRYRLFETNFSPFAELLDSDVGWSARDAFVLRALLVHEYRRLLLKSTELPPQLLPADWPGHRVIDLVRELYGKTHSAASEYAMNCLQDESGALPPPGAGFYSRFGTLEAA